jgi:hypothetical protein
VEEENHRRRLGQVHKIILDLAQPLWPGSSLERRAGVTESLSRRERKKLATRQALLMAALSLFRGKGYDATTVEEITERADVAKGIFFNYLPSIHTSSAPL